MSEQKKAGITYGTPFVAKYTGDCANCGGRIERGQKVKYRRIGRVEKIVHDNCDDC
jgi:hypothetical protein